jgi:hypothetical protein
MTSPSTPQETPATLLAPLARGLLRRQPAILSLSIHDDAGTALWSSGDFLLAEDHALVAEVIASAVDHDEHDARGQGCGLWWESADTARARCALAIFDGGEFCGVALAVFSGLTAGEAERGERIAEIEPALPALAKVLRKLARPQPAACAVIAELRFDRAQADDDFARDIDAGREEQLLELIDSALHGDEFTLHLQPIVSPSDEEEQLILEVLLSLPTQEFGVLASHEFIDTAERNGRMPAIDRWVIRALLVWMKRNRERWADAPAVFLVALSGQSVARPEFRNYLEQCLDMAGLPPGVLRFEIDGLDAGIPPEGFAALARSLAARGCEISSRNAASDHDTLELEHFDSFELVIREQQSALEAGAGA